MKELFLQYTTKFDLPYYTHIVMFDDGSGYVRSAKHIITDFEDLFSFNSLEQLITRLQECIDNSSPYHGDWE